MAEDMSVLEAISTTRSLRRFKPDPIPDDVLTTLLRAATRAPSGRNAQPWRLVVIRDADLRRRVGEVYRQAWDEYSPPGRLAAISDPRERRRVESAVHLGHHMGDEAPVLVLFCGEREESSDPVRQAIEQRTAGASIYPAVQNLLLAARVHGIGGCLTTIFIPRERQVKEILGIPDQFDLYALVPLGYPTEPFGPVRRRPIGEIAFADRWGTPYNAGE